MMDSNIQEIQMWKNMQMMVVVQKYCMDDMDHCSPSDHINITVIKSSVFFQKNLPEINYIYCLVIFELNNFETVKQSSTSATL